MRRGCPLLLPLASVGLLLLALTADPPSAARALLPHADPVQVDRVETGVGILRALLLVDAVVLLLLTWMQRGVRHGLPGTKATRPVEPVAWGGWAVTGLLSATALVRLVGIGGDLWMDEVFTLVNYVQPGLGTVVGDFADDNQHVLYSLLAWASLQLFGETATALRLPALAFGVASVWATLQLGRRALGVREAWCAAALLALSYHHVWFSQNARGYTMLLFATVLATDLYLRARDSGSVRIWVAYAITLSLGTWAHLTMVFVGAAHALITGALYWRERGSGSRRLAPVWALTLAGWVTAHLYAVTLPQMVAYFNQPGAGSTTGGVAWSRPIWLVNETVRNLGVGLGLGWLGAGGAVAFGAYGLLRVWRRAPLLSVAMLLPSLLGGLTMLALGRSLWPRFLFGAFGFCALIAISGAVGLGDWLTRVRGWRRGWAVAPALLLVLVSAATVPRVYRYPKQDYTSARDYVRGNLAPGDQVVALHMAGRVYNRYYATEWDETSTLDELTMRRAEKGRIWVLYTLPSYLAEARPELAAVLEAEFELMQVFPGTLGDGQIVVRRSRAPEAPRGASDR